ncbi:MAG: aminotransferase class V-fold PLP-dependent enzyme [Bacteroidota bacterium]|nr:aminotransferase class V-fold PLP-dependent enzyme [Bacteroidota bacterium]
MSENKTTYYFDNSATSYPKPPQVAKYISRYINSEGGTYGRSAYGKVLDVSRTVETCRDKLAVLMGTDDSDNICFTHNATHALNTIIKGFSLKGKHVLTSPLEHNSVARPLQYLKDNGTIDFSILPAHADGTIIINKIKDCIKPNTALVIICHESNVNGVIQPIKAIKKAIGKLPLLLDATQSFGHTPVKVDEWNIDFMAFTGHKGLLGPTGTGGFYVKNPEPLSSLLHGGTGSLSDSLEMPQFMPDKFEAGTPNIVGIYGLLGAIENRPASHHSKEDICNIINKLKLIDGLTIYAADNSNAQGELFSITHIKKSSSEMATELYSEFGIECRSGFHCAPLAHSALKTGSNGTLRFSFSPYHTPKDFDYLYKAILKTAACE